MVFNWNGEDKKLKAQEEIPLDGKIIIIKKIENNYVSTKTTTTDALSLQPSIFPIGRQGGILLTVPFVFENHKKNEQQS